MNWFNARLVTYGFLLGTAGVKLLTSQDAKKAYTHVTAAVMRGTDYVIGTANNLKENCLDIVADARDINEKRAEEADRKLIEDAKAILAEKDHLN